MEYTVCDFKRTWEGVSYNDEYVLPLVAINEIRCLLIHIDRGCLSGIKPGCGTNRNERLHKDLNSHLTQNRYGVEFAYALITSQNTCQTSRAVRCTN